MSGDYMDSDYFPNSVTDAQLKLRSDMEGSIEWRNRIGRGSMAAGGKSHRNSRSFSNCTPAARSWWPIIVVGLVCLGVVVALDLCTNRAHGAERADHMRPHEMTLLLPLSENRPNIVNPWRVK